MLWKYQKVIFCSVSFHESRKAKLEMCCTWEPYLLLQKHKCSCYIPQLCTSCVQSNTVFLCLSACCVAKAIQLPRCQIGWMIEPRCFIAQMWVNEWRSFILLSIAHKISSGRWEQMLCKSPPCSEEKFENPQQHVRLLLTQAGPPPSWPRMTAPPSTNRAPPGGACCSPTLATN